ncbi:hypothetical protein LX97_02874 [Nonlabens dokdonensis]|jgi:hypothetical protein|uniref:RND transporter n=2 Tax=Nonlabens dokdonensis TaxID=328515 RepID=L7WEJ8_NONDD|nr:hypothetical protein [Nonlabens dokdonensis]AGC78336.1 hypothetical protein DDD_3209 [Nonlabens dokdonensis DSW-6]PZX37779.1 hypothetical protein LX97_02874 [Nonlabens dokdonensis]
MSIKTKILFALVASLTLGLAPFRPEPHIWGKIKWIAGGAEGMQLLDYWDTFLHGAPWIALMFFTIQFIAKSIKTDEK